MTEGQGIDRTRRLPLETSPASVTPSLDVAVDLHSTRLPGGWRLIRRHADQVKLLSLWSLSLPRLEGERTAKPQQDLSKQKALFEIAVDRRVNAGVNIVSENDNDPIRRSLMAAAKTFGGGNTLNSFSKESVRRFIAMMFTLSLASGAMHAQTTRGVITGHVTDPTGTAVVANATVTLIAQGTGISETQTTNASGDYTFNSIEPGVYTLQVSGPTFSTAKLTDIKLDLASTLREDVALQVAGATAQVTVLSAITTLIDADTPTIATLIDQKQIQEQPLNGRSTSYSLMGLAAGVQRANSNALISGSSFQGGTTSTVDGVIQNDLFNARMADPVPSLEAIAEFKVIATNAPAEYGRGGAQVIYATRSGTNDFHGSVFGFNRNRFAAARGFFLRPPAVNPAFNRNEYGASLGGPIVRGKLFFFGSYEDLRLVSASTTGVNSPTVAFKNGDFSSAIGTYTVYDPTTGKPFPGNIIPQARFSDSAKKLQAYYSDPNTAGNAAFGLGTNFTFSDPTRTTDPRYFIRGDWQVTPRDRLMGRYYQATNINAETPFYAGNNSLLFGNFKNQGTLTKNAVVNYTHIFNQSIVNEFIYGYNHERDPNSDQNNNIDPASIIPGALSSPAPNGGLPNVSISNYTRVGGSGGDFNNGQHAYQVANNLNIIRGNHSIRVGFQYISQRAGQGGVQLGNYSVDGRYTGQYGSTALTGPNGKTQSVNAINSYADFLLGYLTSSSRSNRTPLFDTAGKSYSFYGEDSWKVSKRFTLDLGLRYDKTFPFFRTVGGLSNYYPSLNKLVTLQGTPDPTLLNAYPIISGQSVGINRGNYMITQNLNFAPRLGFALRLDEAGTLVVRGGFGLFYNYFNSIINGLATNPPYIATTSYAVNGSLTPSLTFSNAFPAATAALPTNINISGVERNPKTPYNEQWNLTVEKQYGSSTAFRLTYIGNQGHHLYQPFNLNDPQPQAIPSGSSLQALRPYQPWGSITMTQFDTDTNLNQLQAEARRRFAGLSFDLQYQYTRALGIDGANDGTPTNNRNIAHDYGNLDFYARHFLKFSHSYELPIGKNHMLLSNVGPGLDRIVSGWRLNGILSANTGQPYSVSFTSTDPGEPSGRANRVPGVPLTPAHQNWATGWFNPAAFAPIAAGTYGFGNSPRNMLFGPNFITYDAGVFKNTRINDRISLELRAEAFNSLNRTNFNNPNSNISSNTVGQITSDVSPRQMQFGGRIQF